MKIAIANRCKIKSIPPQSHHHVKTFGVVAKRKSEYCTPWLACIPSLTPLVSQSGIITTSALYYYSVSVILLRVTNTKC